MQDRKSLTRLPGKNNVRGKRAVWKKGLNNSVVLQVKVLQAELLSFPFLGADFRRFVRMRNSRLHQFVLIQG